MTKYIMREPMFDSTVEVFIGNHKRFIRECQRYDKDFRLEKECQGFTCFFSAYRTGMIFIKESKQNMMYVTASHEIIHFSIFLMDYLDIDIDRGGGNETLCYIHDYYFKELLKRMNP